MAEREPGGVRLRVVDAEARLEDEPVGVQLRENRGEPAVSLRGVGGRDRLAVVVELAERARADDAGHEALAARAVGRKQAGLVVVGLRGEPRVLLRELELRRVARERVVAREAEEHLVVARLREDVGRLLARERAGVDGALRLGDDGLEGGLGCQHLDVGALAGPRGLQDGHSRLLGGFVVAVVGGHVVDHDVVFADGEVEDGLLGVDDLKGVLGGELGGFKHAVHGTGRSPDRGAGERPGVDVDGHSGTLDARNRCGDPCLFFLGEDIG